MPTYIFDRVEPVEEIISNDGKFGPEMAYQAESIHEMLNVFGGVEWALFMHGTPDDTSREMDENPFVSISDIVWSKTPVSVAEMGSVGIVQIVRQACIAMLHAKYGDNERTMEYINEAEHQDGYAYWHHNFSTSNGVDRYELMDDFETYWASQEVNPMSS